MLDASDNRSVCWCPASSGNNNNVVGVGLQNWTYFYHRGPMIHLAIVLVVFLRRLPTVDFSENEHQTSQKTTHYLGGHLGTRKGILIIYQCCFFYEDISALLAMYSYALLCILIFTLLTQPIFFINSRQRCHV
jgi:hypothetical protein